MHLICIIYKYMYIVAVKFIKIALTPETYPIMKCEVQQFTGEGLEIYM